MTKHFVIDGKLQGLNEFLAAANKNRYKGGTLKKSETTRCGYAIMAQNVPTFSTPVTVFFKWVEPNLKRDPDNVSCGQKFVLDALVQLKRIPNDSRKWIKGIYHEFPDPDPRHPRVEVTISSVPQTPEEYLPIAAASTDQYHSR